MQPSSYPGSEDGRHHRPLIELDEPDAIRRITEFLPWQEHDPNRPRDDEPDPVAEEATRILREQLEAEGLLDPPKGVRIGRRSPSDTEDTERVSTGSTFSDETSALSGHDLPDPTECPRVFFNSWGVGEESGAIYRHRIITCQRRTCDVCRPRVDDRDAATVLAAFDPEPQTYMIEVPEGEWETVSRRVKRRLHRIGRPEAFVQIPTEGNRRLVVTVVPTTSDASDDAPVTPATRKGHVLRAIHRRPSDGRRMTSGGLPDAVDEGPRTFLDAAKPHREKIRYEGRDVSRVTNDQLVAVATEIGCPVERVEEDGKVVAVRFPVRWMDPRAEYLRRWVGFRERKPDETGPPLSAYWKDDPYLRKKRPREDEPPIEVYEPDDVDGQLAMQGVGA